MMDSAMDDAGVRMRVWGKELAIIVSQDRADQARELARTVWRTPFTRRTWSELLFLAIGWPLAVAGVAFVLLTLVGGAVLAITFIGVIVMAACVRGARGFGSMQRGLARGLLDEQIEEPEPFSSRPGFFGWLQSALRDRSGWRSMAYLVVKLPLAAFGFYTAFSLWWDAFACLTHTLWNSGQQTPPVFGLVRNLFPPGFLSIGTSGPFHGIAIFVTGVIFFFAAPWAVRGVVYLDRLLMRALLAPDSMTVRVRSLEHARAQTVDASAATLRRIERDLHDGTQAQLVALAMRLGIAKEKLAAGAGTGTAAQVDLDQVRALVDDAHRGAKEALVELRDLARGIHPPALDTGLEGALSTLAARSPVPTEVTLALIDRPTPAIESIAYFCVAELLANVAQHADAGRASVSCAQYAQWLRLVVRDDGKGGAEPAKLGSSSSGLAGLTDRVHAVDGRLNIASPPGGPTVVTVDLPLHA
jgi:signal transduction histidine kinase